ncbi:MAG: OsmC family protein [Candidatus Bipolaricaulota bacterium]|nr:OsmC family protein [Candidatus Bipolaricaulota bacterium]
MTVVTYTGGMRFVGRGASGHDVVMDASETSGGHNTAARPVEVLLASLGACTGMDVIAILRKSQDVPTTFRVEIADERATDYPKVLKRIHLSYVVSGEVPRERLEKAIELSLAKYCPIANSLAGIAEITYETRFE